MAGPDNVLELVQGDNGPDISAILRNENGIGAVLGKPSTYPPLDLTGDTVTAAAVKVGTTTAIPLAVTVVDEAGGSIRITTEPLLTNSGTYRVEVTRSPQGQGRVTVSNWVKIIVRPRIVAD